MNITLGVYDLFAYAVPGSLYLALLSYIGDRLTWISPAHLLRTDTAVVLILAAIASYLLGHVTFDIGRLLSRVSGRRRDMTYAAREFARRVPEADGRPFLQADRAVLQAAVEMHADQAAVEIVRLRAISLMLRNSAPPFLLATVTAIADAISGEKPLIAVCCSVLFLCGAVGCFTRSMVWWHWANMKTLDLAYWVPDVDRRLRGQVEKADTEPAQRSPRSPRSRPVIPQPDAKAPPKSPA